MANAGTHGRKNFSFSTAVPLTTVTFVSHVNAGLRVNAVKIQLMLKRTQKLQYIRGQQSHVQTLKSHTMREHHINHASIDTCRCAVGCPIRSFTVLLNVVLQIRRKSNHSFIAERLSNKGDGSLAFNICKLSF